MVSDLGVCRFRSPVLRLGLLSWLASSALLGSCVERPPQDASGGEIYQQVCSRCHAPDLSGGIGPPLGPNSGAASQPDEQISQTISRGKGRMPSLSNTLSEDQIERVIAYLREQQGT